MIDRAIVLPPADFLKIISLFIGGAALRQSARRAPAAVQLFFADYALPMGVWLGVYLAASEQRLCNAYSLESQGNAGRCLVLLCLVAGVFWVSQIIAGKQPEDGANLTAWA